MSENVEFANEGLYDILGRLVDSDSDEVTRVTCAEILRDWPYARQRDREDVLNTALELRTMLNGYAQIAVDDLCEKLS